MLACLTVLKLPFSAALERYVFAPPWQGGGLRIRTGGVANFDGCNVYANIAKGYARLLFEFLRYFLHRPTETLRVCARGWQWGGGLQIRGTATLTNTNVYENRVCTFKDCQAGTAGQVPRNTHSGGIFVDFGGKATLINSNVYQNVANDVRLLSEPAFIALWNKRALAFLIGWWLQSQRKRRSDADRLERLPKRSSQCALASRSFLP